MFHITSRLFVACLMAAACFAAPAPAARRSVSDIQNDISNIADHSSSLNSAIQAFSGDAGDAYSILGDGALLNWDISQTTYHIQETGSLSETDASTILSSLSAIAPTLSSILSGLAGKESTFASLHSWNSGGFPSLIKDDLTNFSSEVQSIESALLSACPSDLHSTITSFASALLNAGSAAIAAF